MRDEIIAFALNIKAGATIAISSPFLAWTTERFGLIDFSMTGLSVLAAFVLTVVMIVSHICNMVWKNRELRSVLRERELKIELMKKELRGDNE